MKNELHTSLPLNDTLPKIAEDYFQERVNSGTFSETNYRRRLKKLRKTDGEIYDILIELDDDFDKFLLKGMPSKRAKLIAVLGFSAAISLMVITILMATGKFLSGNIIIVFTSGIGTGIVTGLKGLNELKMEKYRKERRMFKWENWK